MSYKPVKLRGNLGEQTGGYVPVSSRVDVAESTLRSGPVRIKSPKIGDIFKTITDFAKPKQTFDVGEGIKPTQTELLSLGLGPIDFDNLTEESRKDITQSIIKERITKTEVPLKPILTEKQKITKALTFFPAELAKGLVRIGLEITDSDSKLIPATEKQIAILGDEPIKRLAEQSLTADITEAGLKKAGFGDELSKNTGLLSGALMVGFIENPFLLGTGKSANKLLEKTMKELIEKGSGKSLSKESAQRLSEDARIIINITDKKERESIVKEVIQREVQATKPKREIKESVSERLARQDEDLIIRELKTEVNEFTDKQLEGQFQEFKKLISPKKLDEIEDVEHLKRVVKEENEVVDNILFSQDGSVDDIFEAFKTRRFKDIEKKSVKSQLKIERKGLDKLKKRQAKIEKERSLKRDITKGKRIGEKVGEFKTTRELKPKIDEVKKLFKKKTASINSMRKASSDFISKNLPVSERGQFLKSIASSKTPGDINKIFTRAVDTIDKFEEARVLSTELGKERSKIAFIRKIGEFNQTVVSEIKREVGLTQPLAKATAEQLESITNKLKERLKFKTERGFKPQQVVEGKIVPESKEKPVFTDDFYKQNIPVKEDIKTKSSNILSSLNETRKKISESFGDFLTPISTRLKNIAPELKFKLRKFEKDLGSRNVKDFKVALPFIKKLSKIKDKEDLAIFDIALKNGDQAKINEIVKKHGLDVEFKRVKGLLEDLFKRARDVDFDIGYLNDYFPRMVKDFDGYLKFIEKKIDDDKEFNLILEAFERKEMDLGRKLTTSEKVNMVNVMTRGYKGGQITLSKVGAMKERTIDVIDKDINKFYFDTNESLMNYIQTMNDAIESRKFFGKELKLDKLGLLHLGDSIGSYIVKLLSENKINFDDSIRLKKTLEKRFNQQGTRGIVSVIKNLEYIDVLGSVKNTVTQLGDLGFATYFAKGSVFKGFGKAVSPQKINEKFGAGKFTREDLGISDVAQEFSDNDFSGKSVARVLRITGFEKVDSIGKETLINGVFSNAKRLQKKGDAGFLKETKEIFGDEALQVREDIRLGRNTENVKLYLFNKLADVQPIALSEMPERYLSSGNGRIFYMLKTFTIKQFDVFRNESFALMNEGIKNGDKKQVVQGFKNLLRLASTLTVFGVAADTVKDMMTGKETDIDDLVVNNILKFMGINKYVLDYSKREGVGSAIAGVIKPPSKILDNALKDFNKSVEINDAKSIRSIPVGGELYYWWFGGGAKKEKEVTKKRSRRVRSRNRT